MLGADVITYLTEVSIAIVANGGYVGIFFLMAMESMFFPVPSEAVMPPAGILVSEGRLDFVLVAVVATLGSLAGSLASYAIGRGGAAPFVRRWGKWFLLREKHLDEAHAFFEKRGVAAVFFARFVPGVRHVSSIPAGAASMSLLPFCVATVLGAGLWNLVLLWAGVALGHNWDRLLPYFEYVEFAALAALVAAVVWIVAKRRKAARMRDESA